MLTIHWRQGSDKLDIWHNNSERSINCSCLVRNEVNGWRQNNQVVYSLPDELPYQPRIFPVGRWEIGEPLECKDPYKAPYFIPTNAFQMLPVWEIKDGHYVKATDKMTRDDGYGLHCSTSNTTLGCIKIINLDDLLQLIDEIKYMLYNDIKPILIGEE